MYVRSIFNSEFIPAIMESYAAEQQQKDTETAKQMPALIMRITEEIIKPEQSKSEAGGTQFSTKRI